MPAKQVSKRLAKRISVSRKLLRGRRKSGLDSVRDAISHLGYVQVDTISVINRAHHHTLWNRVADYRPEMLHHLQAVERSIFEYWGHAASYLPVSDYRFYLPKMEEFYTPRDKWEQERYKRCGHLLPGVLERIRKEGPLGSKDFDPPPGEKSGDWWSWKPAKLALELLFWQGKLMISERRKFQKVYDLTERVLPEAASVSEPSDEELSRWRIDRALSACGIAREKEIREYIFYRKKSLKTTLNEMVAEGSVTELALEGSDDHPYFAHTDTLDSLRRLRKTPPRLTLLSPFDNLVIQRDRTSRIWDFDYTIECYVPAPKRKYGYFVLPVLWGDDLVARLDPHADRKKKILTVKALYLEEKGVDSADWLPALAAELQRFAEFNSCERIVVARTKPAKIAAALRREIKSLR
jgi:uncharacterized protein